MYKEAAAGSTGVAGGAAAIAADLFAAATEMELEASAAVRGGRFDAALSQPAGVAAVDASPVPVPAGPTSAPEGAPKQKDPLPHTYLHPKPWRELTFQMHNLLARCVSNH